MKTMIKLADGTNIEIPLKWFVNTLSSHGNRSKCYSVKVCIGLCSLKILGMKMIDKKGS